MSLRLIVRHVAPFLQVLKSRHKSGSKHRNNVFNGLSVPIDLHNCWAKLVNLA